MRYYVTIEGRVLEAQADGDAVRMADAAGAARVLGRSDGPTLCLSVANRPHRVYAVRRGDTDWEIHFRGRSFRVEVADEKSWRIRQARGSEAAAVAGLEPLRAPMPGLVLRVDVEVGQQVAQGQALLIVEAMKMENELRARASAHIRRVHVAAGESVRRGDVLIEFEQDGEDKDARDGQDNPRDGHHPGGDGQDPRDGHQRGDDGHGSGR